ncbi:Hypothetical predicted protein [Xyrichtys novacula]|uniref:Uncharacterized protein n=1 Tax=Xyrichtys novacula TaxID=13765 RepID=A0AAV1HG69_XYRNO|nr:Hypothetical predicted protein [Xyrichtys novacula]
MPIERVDVVSPVSLCTETLIKEKQSTLLTKLGLEHTQLQREHSQLVQEHSKLVLKHSKLLTDYNKLLKADTLKDRAPFELQNERESLKEKKKECNMLTSQLRDVKAECRKHEQRWKVAEEKLMEVTSVLSESVRTNSILEDTVRKLDSKVKGCEGQIRQLTEQVDCLKAYQLRFEGDLTECVEVINHPAILRKKIIELRVFYIKDNVEPLDGIAAAQICTAKKPDLRRKIGAGLWKETQRVNPIRISDREYERLWENFSEYKKELEAAMGKPLTAEKEREIWLDMTTMISSFVQPDTSPPILKPHPPANPRTPITSNKRTVKPMATNSKTPWCSKPPLPPIKNGHAH